MDALTSVRTVSLEIGQAQITLLEAAERTRRMLIEALQMTRDFDNIYTILDQYRSYVKALEKLEVL